MSSNAIKYIGRKTDFKGKTLWEIVGDLKDYGIGRMIIRNMFQRYKEPCYMRILNVQAVDDEKKFDTARKVKVTVQKTWRGVTLPNPIEIFSTSYKADYELVSKEDEYKYLNNTSKVEETVLNSEVEFPPLFKLYIEEETGQKNPTMKVHIRPSKNKFIRLTEESDVSTRKMTMGLGEPRPEARKFYESVLE